jgi:hypothetical protein
MKYLYIALGAASIGLVAVLYKVHQVKIEIEDLGERMVQYCSG